MLDLLGPCGLEASEEARVGSEDRASWEVQGRGCLGKWRCNSIGRKHAFWEKLCSDEIWLHKQLGS